MERLRTSNKVVGLKQSKKAIESDLVALAYVARDADMHVVFPFEGLCKNKGIEIVYVNNMKELGKYCGVEVPTAVAVILND